MIRPRFTEHHNIFKAQSELDFAIPLLDEDIPLYVDPFLLWKSPSYQDKALHGSIVNSFNRLGHLAKKGDRADAVRQLITASECDEVGLGQSSKRRGTRIGETQAQEVLNLFDKIPAYGQRGFTHFEEIQLFVSGISQDRVSDFACSFMKSFLVDFTMDQCQALGIPLVDCKLKSLYDPGKYEFVENVAAKLPVHPKTGVPLLLVPKRWLRFSPWISFEEYFRDYCPKDEIFNLGEGIDHVKVLTFNRDNYGIVERYVREKERTFADCKNDPLFQQIPVLSAKRKMAEISGLPSGKDNNADHCCPIKNPVKTVGFWG